MALATHYGVWLKQGQGSDVCGIVGFVDLSGKMSVAELTALVVDMRESLTHRGPDDAGTWVDPEGGCALGHRRLSVIDLSEEGRQPMGNEDGSVQVTYNGEIYNFRSLREELSGLGHVFRSQTDSEVLPHLFESFDTRLIQKIEGMFAFGVWHRHRRQLLLARDAFGEKPLYYSQGSGWFAFASEVQAFYRLPGFEPAIDRSALAWYLLLQYIPAPYSIFRSVRKLPPGSALVVNSDGDGPVCSAVQRWYRFSPREPAGALAEGPLAQHRDELRVLVRQAVEKRLVADVPLGAFLSGGVDSAVVAAMVRRELDRPLRTFSIGFAGTDDSEHLYAREVAEYLGTDHQERILSPDALALVHDVAARLDEPNGDSSCLPTFLLCEFAREQVTVALSGDGGDELFGGYGRYRDVLLEQGSAFTRLGRSLLARLRGSQAGSWTPSSAYLSSRLLSFLPAQVATLLGSIPAEVQDILSQWRRDLDGTEQPLLHRLRRLDADTYMPGAVLAKVDRMSMQVALEVRCPLLDIRIADFAAQLPVSSCWQPPDQTKKVLKDLACRYLPAEWMQRRKMGFGLPSSAWSQTSALGLANDLLGSRDSALGAYVDQRALRALIRSQSQPGGFSIYQLWPLLVLELWLRRKPWLVQGSVTYHPQNAGQQGRTSDQ